MPLARKSGIRPESDSLRETVVNGRARRRRLEVVEGQRNGLHFQCAANVGDGIHPGVGFTYRGRGSKRR